MTRYYLTMQLRSDTTFGRGAGVAGLVDLEIEHDQHGCPFIGGRALKGLLVEEWANLRFALGNTSDWDAEAEWLFGTSGDIHAHMHVGTATLPPDLVAAIQAEKTLQPQDVLASLTAIRRQTSIDAEDGAPQDSSLRAIRVLLRDTFLVAPLDFDADFSNKDRTLGLLTACTLAVRRGGTARNRGRGRLQLLLHEAEPSAYTDATFTEACFATFARLISPNEVQS
ncbi:MAG: hypothetical protein MUD01_05010 [Chloroflexaceae bacterium]|jgi:hypothetical protein|nr:hypothetical protein [Chloroflexaceae bacterium]